MFSFPAVEFFLKVFHFVVVVVTNKSKQMPTCTNGEEPKRVSLDTRGDQGRASRSSSCVGM